MQVAAITSDVTVLDNLALIDALKEYKDVLERLPSLIKLYEDSAEAHINATSNKVGYSEDRQFDEMGL